MDSCTHRLRQSVAGRARFMFIRSSTNSTAEKESRGELRHGDLGIDPLGRIVAAMPVLRSKRSSLTSTAGDNWQKREATISFWSLVISHHEVPLHVCRLPTLSGRKILRIRHCTVRSRSHYDPQFPKTILTLSALGAPTTKGLKDFAGHKSDFLPHLFSGRFQGRTTVESHPRIPLSPYSPSPHHIQSVRFNFCSHPNPLRIGTDFGSHYLAFKR